MKEIITASINSHLDAVNGMLDAPDCLSAIEELGKLATQTLKAGNKILLCGNGGSAADSQHIAAELVGRFSKNRRALPALALTVDSSALTAIANDFSFEELFSRQVEGLGKKGDLLIGISTSGNSPNVARAMEAARQMGIKTAGLTGGKKDTRVVRAADICVCIPSFDTPRIQEAHILVGHVVCEIVEKELFGA